jgi:hypothetical protein
MRRRSTSKKYSDIKPWVRRAVDSEDHKSRGELWLNEPSATQQYIERLRRIKFLRKHGAINMQAVLVADRLDCCDQGQRCLSAACPECSRLLQRWFVRQSDSFIRNHLDQPNTDLLALSIVPRCQQVAPGSLTNFSICNLQRRLKEALRNVDINVAVGGIDFSFNEDRQNKYQPFWCPHYYLIISTKDRDTLARRLAKIFPRSLEIPRPTRISGFTNIAYRRSYALKTEFRRRIGCVEEKEIDGKIRKCRNTSDDKMRASERVELLVFLDQVGLAARVTFFGAKPEICSKGVRICGA